MQVKIWLLLSMLFASHLLFAQDAKPTQPSTQTLPREFVQEIVEGDYLVIIFSNKENTYGFDVVLKNKVIKSENKKIGSNEKFKSKEEAISAAKEALKHTYGTSKNLLKYFI